MIYSVGLCAAGIAVCGFLLGRVGVMSDGASIVTAVLLVAFSLFTITMGFPHPGFGHVSFDRVGQVAAILLVGPVDAAWISAIASLLYPWKRLYEGERLRLVVMASVHNAGLMTFVVLGGGYAYVLTGGKLPLDALTTGSIASLAALIVVMQVLNDVGMMVIFRLRGQDPGKLLTAFTTAVETGSALVAILVAVIVASYDTGVIVLLLVVLALGMFVLKRYAEMRTQLEALVEERTEALRRKSLELERQATHDDLTGLYNRRYADDFLARLMSRLNRGGDHFSVALADIDHFKRINDRHTHAAGDRVLERVADIFAARCRQTDIVARYGGEEFLLCFPETRLDQAEKICQQLCDAVREANWADVASDDELSPVLPKITVSFGVAQSRDDRGLETLLNDADLRLYQAKNGGRDRVIA